MASDRVLISMSREDAQAFALGGLDYVVAVAAKQALPGGSIMRARQAALVVLESPDGIDPAMVEAAARAANLDAGRQRGLAFEDDWDEITEQERGGWRLVARAALRAAAGTDTEGEEA